MMGLSPAEARRRFDEIIEFAGLQDYVDLQVKNYSSGMKVRLGFAVMTHVDADVLLIDEVLAVGDAEFQETLRRCLRGDASRGPDDPARHPQHADRDPVLRAGAAPPRGRDRHDRRARHRRRALLRRQPDSAMLERPDRKLPEMSSKIVAAIADPLRADRRRVDRRRRGRSDRQRSGAGAPIHLRRHGRRRARDYPDAGFRFRSRRSDGRILFTSDTCGASENGSAPAGDVIASGDGREPAARRGDTRSPRHLHGRRHAGRPDEDDPARDRRRAARRPMLLEHEITVSANAARARRRAG